MASATEAELEEMTVWGTGKRQERTTLNRERTARREAPQPRTEGPFKKKKTTHRDVGNAVGNKDGIPEGTKVGISVGFDDG